jgi:hypothetical protein
MKTYRKEKEDDIIFNKPTINSEDYPEIMWKKTSTDTFVKRRRISVTIMVSISTQEEDIEEEALDTWNEICRTKHIVNNNIVKASEWQQLLQQRLLDIAYEQRKKNSKNRRVSTRQ